MLIIYWNILGKLDKDILIKLIPPIYFNVATGKY